MNHSVGVAFSLFTTHKQRSFTQFPTVAASTLSYSHHALVVYLLAVEWGSPHYRRRRRRLKFASFVISFSFACSPLKATQQRAAAAAASFVVLLLSISWSYFFLAISAAKLDE